MDLDRLSPSPVFVLGYGCRMPGAANPGEFWRLFDEGRCTVVPEPHGRWNVRRFLHERRSEPGFSYSFGGSYIEQPFAFDPQAFGISPREARQIDPQQRILLEVVHEALEDAGLPPSRLAGQEVGVYVGASSLDYANLHIADPPSIESHFMTGNTLSVVSNRISYVFDWHGPSFTVDTACSSSLVALSEAVSAIRSGRIDVAVVAGVNMLFSPGSFVGFSRASMLSPTGLCRPFSAAGDGYVRAEGAVALVICRDGLKLPETSPRAAILGAAINSDGRTSGIALPSTHGQRRLLEHLYDSVGVHPEQLAFVEAHGTGTAVGDPVEARAIGEALGQRRSQPLPIGAGKSNHGHLEPASGVAAVLKSILAMEHRRLPKILHLDEPNPLIDFAALNLVAAREPIDLAPEPELLHCGISSFGFGGTNAHAILREATPAERGVPPAAQRGKTPPARREPELLMLSAYAREALTDLARRYAEAIEGGADAGVLAAATTRRRDHLSHRLAVPVAEAGATLAAFARGESAPRAVVGRLPSAPVAVAFVYSGNGSQWAGMGRVPFARNAAFRAEIERIDQVFQPMAGWSIAEVLADDAPIDLVKTSATQPLIFAVQAAGTAALRAAGIVPALTLGHSLGEVAAAWAAGALTLEDAVTVIHRRSLIQEGVRGLGTMAVVARDAEAVEGLIRETGLVGAEIAAVNSPSSVTVSGDGDAVRALCKAARSRRIATRLLDIDYPFHSGLMGRIEAPLREALLDIRPRDSEAGFVSSAVGALRDGSGLDSDYWWHNARDPVLFRQGTEAAAALGATLFIEIGARPVVNGNLADTLKAAGLPGEVVTSFGERDEREAGDPVLATVARALVAGAPVDEARLFGTPVTGRVDLPLYPWQHRSYAPHATSEAVDLFQDAPRHPLIGGRLSAGSSDWRALIDPVLVPYLADHRVEGEIILPGAAYAEMALAVARQTWPQGPLALDSLDILQPLVLGPETIREVSVRYAGAIHLVEVWSRARLSDDEWTLHARGRVGPATGAGEPLDPGARLLPIRRTGAEVYAAASACGLDYGPSFRAVLGIRRDREMVDVALAPRPPETAGRGDLAHVLHPAVLDAAFHALFDFVEQRPGQRRTYLPIRFGALRVFQDGLPVSRAVLSLNRDTDDRLDIDLALYGPDGLIVATLANALFRSVTLSYDDVPELHYRSESMRLDGSQLDAAALVSGAVAERERSEAWLLLDAFALSLADRTLRRLFGTDPFEFGALFGDPRVAEGAVPMVVSMLELLTRFRLAQELRDEGTPDTWRLAPAGDLPAPEVLLAEVIATDPAAAAEAAIAAQVLDGFDERLATGTALAIRAPLLEGFRSASILFAPLLDQARAMIEALVARAGGEPVRIAVAAPGALALMRLLAPFVASGAVSLSLAGEDSKVLAQVLARSGLKAGVDLIDLKRDAASDAAASAMDLVLVLADEPLFGGEAAPLRRLARRLDRHGAFVVLQPPQDPAFDVLFGLTPGWFQKSLDPHFPLGRLPATDTTRRFLASAFADVAVTEFGGGAGAVLVASGAKSAPASTAAATPDRSLALLDAGSAGPVLVRAFEAASFGVAQPGDRTADAVLWLGGDGSSGERERIAIAVQRVAAVLAGIGDAHRRVWLVVPGDAPAVADAMRAFARVATNETPHAELRVVDLAPDLLEAGLPSPAAAEALARLVAAPRGDRELRLDARGTGALRTLRGLPRALAAPLAPAAQLTVPRPGAVDTFRWSPAERRAPGPGEIEIAVAATGLNFRDVMLAMGLLDDDVLDEGLAGAVFGFECAGTVVAVGAGVRDRAVGERVMGFAAGAFATHVTAPSGLFAPVPDGVTPEAAAGVPVAFLTAWYALTALAALRPGDWVLIHGAAGGVGLAAIQIARLKGARIAATVGTEDKRALVALLGAERVYNSRSTAFADEIRRDIGGVDVVLNSLSGEAMLASVGCLKPFGRFIELGKRDYVANTMLGLRPFRRNLMYFGVDVDQLLAARPDEAARLMTEIAAAFAAGDLRPLLHRVFEPHEVAGAFRLMQAAGHVGKIVIRPPAEGVPASAEMRRFKPAQGVHLVVGGTRGFGFATALWLLEAGAPVVAVASRSGRLDPDVEAKARPALEAGRLVVETVDAADPVAVEALLGRLAVCGPLRGVVHAAMVLSDALVANLDPVALDAVLAPKVDGARNLDRATRGLDLDYFVLYSSATTLFGNPGQGAYVAANGFLEGLARERRAQNLPALAIGWGAIADAGVLARNTDTAATLERATGVVAMPAAAALAGLGRLLANPDLVPDGVVAHAEIHAGPLLRGLPLLQTPAYAGLFGVAGEGLAAVVDVASLIRGKDDAEARALIATLVAEEVARILRLSMEEIDLHRPFSEIGMDSLMALELKMSLEKRLDVELPVVAITALKNLDGLAGHVLGKLRDGGESDGEDKSMTDMQQVLVAQQMSDEVAFADIQEVMSTIEERRQSTRVLL